MQGIAKPWDYLLAPPLGAEIESLLEHLCIHPWALSQSLDPLEILSGLWRRVSSMGVTSSRLEKALAEYPGTHVCLPCLAGLTRLMSAERDAFVYGQAL